jgi:hypothetical protein
MKDMILFYLEAPGIIGGDKTKASAMALEITKIDPVEGAHAEIRVAQRLKQEPHAEELLRKAMAARPESYLGRVALSGFLLGNKDYAAAEREAREAIRIHPGRIGAYGQLVVALVHQDRWNDLDTALAAAEKAVPDDFVPFFRAANNCLSRRVELPRAEQYFLEVSDHGSRAGLARSRDCPLSARAGVGTDRPQGGRHSRTGDVREGGRCERAGEGGPEAAARLTSVVSNK